MLRDIENTGAVIARPYLDTAASVSTIEPLTTADRIEALSKLGQRASPENTENVAVYSKAVLRSLVIGATDAREGWPVPELVPTPDEFMPLDRVAPAPVRRRRYFL